MMRKGGNDRGAQDESPGVERYMNEDRDRY